MVTRSIGRAPALTTAMVCALAWAGLGTGTAVAEPAVSRPAIAQPAVAAHAASIDAAPAKRKDKGDQKQGSKSASPCAATVKACVDLSSHQAWLTDGAGHVTYGPVAARGGSKEAKTPKGSFNVLSKDANYFSREFQAPMPYSVFFYPGDALHAGNPKTESNGCIHLTAGAAQRFFAALNPGDSVQVKG